MHLKIKGSIWIVFGCIAFYLIGFKAKNYLDQRYEWPIIQGRVVANDMSIYKQAQGVSDQGGLLVTVEYQNATGQPRVASYLLTGHVKMINESQQDEYAIGKILNVHISPNGQSFHPTNTNTLGMWGIAAFVALAFIINGMTVFNRKPKTE